MDIFKALGDWLGGGNKKKEQDKQAQVFQQQQAAKAASMPKVLNPAGQQQWMQKNAPSLAKPLTVATPKPEAPKPFSIAPVLPQQTPQPKAPIVAQPIKTPTTPSLSINDRAAETRAQINKVQTNNRQAAQARLAAPTGTFGKSVGDQPMQALRGRSISQFVGDFNKSDSDTQRNLRQTLEKQRDFNSTSVSPEGRSMFKQSQDTLDYLDKLGQSKPTSLKGAISDVGKFGGDLAKGMITAAGAATQPLTAGLAASRSQQAYKSGQINQDQYNREIKNATDGTGGYYFRYGQKPDGNATLLQPSQNDDGSRRNLLDATLKQAQSFVNAGVDTGLTASGIANAPANVSRSLANSTGRNLLKNAAPALKEAAAYQGVDMANQAIQGNNPLDPTYLAQSVGSNALLPLGGYGVGAGARKVLDKASDSLTSRALSNPTLREQVIQPRTSTPSVQIPPRVQQRAIEYGVVTPATRSLSPNERVLTALNSERQPQLPPELPSPQLRADNKGVAFKIDDEWAANRTPAQRNLANALDGDTPSEPISFGRLRDEQVQAANDIFRERGMPEIDNPELRVHPAVVDKLREKRIVNEGLTPEQIADIAHSAVNNRRSVVSDVTDKSRSVQLSTKKGDVQNNAFVGSFDGDGSLKSAYPTSSRRNLISDTPINDQSIRSVSNSVEADRANMKLADSVMDTATTNNVAHNRGGVNDAGSRELVKRKDPPVEVFGPESTVETIKRTAADDLLQGATKRKDLTTPVSVDRRSLTDDVNYGNSNRTGNQFAAPSKAIAMTKGRVNDQQGFISSESPSGNQRRRVVANPETGLMESIVETKNPDGSWVVQKEPAIESKTDFKGIDSLEGHEDLTKAAIRAMDDGKEIHMYAEKNAGDPNNLSATVHEFNPERHVIDGGFVRDANNGAILGNHIKVDDTGIAINIGKEMVNMAGVIGDPAKWKNMNKTSYTLDRILEMASPNKEVYQKVRSFVIEHKQKAEGEMRTELAQYRKEIKDWRSKLLDSKPTGMKKNEYYTDIFKYAEKKLAQLESGKPQSQDQLLVSKYGKQTASEIQSFDKWSRGQYDELLERTNEVLRRFGHEEVSKRENYMTHLQEDSLWDKIGIGEDLYRDLSGGINGEANTHNRGELSGAIAGKTDTFRPTKKYNPFHQARRGSASATDPFRAMDAYGEAANFNIHMTESAVRARSLESVFRAAEEITNKDMLKQVKDDLRGSLKQSLGGKRGDLVVAFQEYANALAGKSSSIDRLATDKFGGTGRATLKVSRLLQRVASQSSIIGNASVTIAQTLNLPNTIGTNGVRNTSKGIVRMMTDMSFNGEPKAGSPASRSDFLKVRYTDAQSEIQKSLLRKTNDKVSQAMLMPWVERGMVELTWNSSYEKARKGGLTGNKAVREADRLTERIVAGRGIGDKPELYRSTAAGSFLQYTLEVNAALKNIRKDMTPYGMVKYAVAVYAMNTVIEHITGRRPLPDFLDASIDTTSDLLAAPEENEEGEVKRGVEDKLTQGVQRFAGESSSLSPIISAFANTFIPQDARKAMFGTDINLGRYDGAPAGTAAASSLIQAGFDAKDGNYDKAIDKSLSVVPYGSQIRKSTQGIGAVNQGYATNSNGKVTTTVEADPLTVIKAALFGKNAIPEVKAYYENGSKPLSTSQQEIFDELKKGGDSAKSFASDVFASRNNVAKKDGDTASAATPESQRQIEAAKRVKLAKGDWKEIDGTVVNKQGEVQRSYYKDIAKSSTHQDESTYAAYLKGYSLEDGTKYAKDKDFTTGSQNLDSLLKANAAVSSKTSLASKAVSLMSDSKKYADMPEWVKERFYKEAGYSKEQVEYAAIADTKMQVRLDNLYRPIAENGDKKALMNALADGRREGIKDKKVWAQDSLITALQKEGHLTKDEAKYLKSLKLDWEHKETKESADKKATTAKSSRGGGKKRSKGGGKGTAKASGYSSADISSFVNTSGIGYNTSIQKILASVKSNSSGKNTKVATKKPTMRSLTSKSNSISKSKSSLSKTKIG